MPPTTMGKADHIDFPDNWRRYGYVDENKNKNFDTASWLRRYTTICH